MLVDAQVAHQRAHPGSVAGRRACVLGEDTGGRRAAATAAPLDPMLGDPQVKWGQVEHLPGLHARQWRTRQVRAAPTTPLGSMPGNLVRLANLRQVRAGGAGLLAGPAPRGPLIVLAACRAGLRSPSEDGGLEELEESLPSRRSSSTTRACSAAITWACSALTARSSTMTAAWTATVASSSGSGGAITASRTTSGHARLPMGRTEQLSHKPQTANSSTARGSGAE
jgi:hypothetical protein